MLAGYVFAETLLGVDVRKADFIPDSCSADEAGLLGAIKNGVHAYLSGCNYDNI